MVKFIKTVVIIVYNFCFNKLYKIFNKQELKFVRMQRDYHPFLFPTLYGYGLKILIESGLIQVEPFCIGKSCISVMVMTWIFNKYRKD